MSDDAMADAVAETRAVRAERAERLAPVVPLTLRGTIDAYDWRNHPPGTIGRDLADAIDALDKAVAQISEMLAGPVGWAADELAQMTRRPQRRPGEDKSG